MNTALLIVDMQNGVVNAAYNREQVIKNVSELVARAREKKVLVIWVQHSSEEMPVGSESWKIVPELKPGRDEIIVHKIHGDSFEETDLKVELDTHGIKRVIVAGAQTDACIRSTIHGAFARGYDTVLVSDAHTTEDLTSYGFPPPEKLIDFTNTYWKFQTGAGKKASVEKASEVKLD